MVRLIGDIHGEWNSYVEVASGSERSIQVGDFGIGFAGPYWHDRVNEFHKDGKHRFIRGNHDNPVKCKTEMGGYIQDGTVENDVMFIGGAWSIDWAYRTEGISWWRDEELSHMEFQNLIDVYSNVKPRIMITHDAPLFVTNSMFVEAGLALGGPSIETRTGRAFEEMFKIHQPDHWLFGHWHVTKETTIEGTRFKCLGELDYEDLDLGI